MEGFSKFIYIFEVALCCVWLVDVIGSFPVNYESPQKLPQLHCPCCSGPVIDGPKAAVPSGCQEVTNNAETFRDALIDVQQNVDKLKGQVARRISDADMKNISDAHWPYVYRLGATEESVQQALIMGEQDAWSEMYELFMLYARYINFILLEEQTWAGTHSGFRRRPLTFEKQSSRLITMIKNVHCSFYLLLESNKIEIDAFTVEKAERVTYRPEINYRVSDLRAFVILNSFQTDYLELMTMYFERFVAAQSCD